MLQGGVTGRSYRTVLHLVSLGRVTVGVTVDITIVVTSWCEKIDGSLCQLDHMVNISEKTFTPDRFSV